MRAGGSSFDGCDEETFGTYGLGLKEVEAGVKNERSPEEERFRFRLREDTFVASGKGFGIASEWKAQW